MNILCSWDTVFDITKWFVITLNWNLFETALSRLFDIWPVGMCSTEHMNASYDDYFRFSTHEMIFTNKPNDKVGLSINSWRARSFRLLSVSIRCESIVSHTCLYLYEIHLAPELHTICMFEERKIESQPDRWTEYM